MIHGIGTDLFEVDRMERLVARGKPYLETIFSENEINSCDAQARKSEHFAARYAAKEALLKALGTGWRGGLAFSDIEVLNDELGKPQVVLHGKVKAFCEEQQLTNILISLSHTKTTAIAVVVLER